jgi:hypothetical protein
MRLSALLVGFGAAASIIGCGGSGAEKVSSNPGADAPPAAKTLITGVASKGPILSGDVAAYEIDSTGQQGKLLSKVTTGASGIYTVDLGNYRGPVLLEASGGFYIDEATGNNVALDTPLRSILPDANGKTSASITPLTEVLVRRIVNHGLFSPDAMSTQPQQAIRILGFDPVSTKPIDAMSPPPATALPTERLYAAALGTISQLMQNNPGMTLEQALKTVEYGFDGFYFGKSVWSSPALARAAGIYATNPRNLTGLPTISPIVPPNPPVDPALAAKSWDQIWNGTWACPATGQRQAEVPAHMVNGVLVLGYTTTVSYKLNLQGKMWCIEEGGKLPVRATQAAADSPDGSYKAGDYICPPNLNKIYNVQEWCADMQSIPFHMLFQAEYTPPPSAPKFITSGSSRPSCQNSNFGPGFKTFLQGNWCLPAGAELPSLAKNNLCVGREFQEGWCVPYPISSGLYPFGPSIPTDPANAPRDAADPLLYDFVQFTYTCPADTYHNAPYQLTGSAFGGPKSGMTSSAPCLAQAKAAESATCGLGSSGFSNTPNINVERANAAYYNCLANNSTEPFKSNYLTQAVDANDRLDFFLNTCTYPQVKRNGVCVDPPPPNPVNTTPGAVSGSATSAQACAAEYSGPNSDPQFDSFCKMAAFDACLHRITNSTAYDTDGHSMCSLLDGLIKSTSGGTYTCGYCPYPYK